MSLSELLLRCAEFVEGLGWGKPQQHMDTAAQVQAIRSRLVDEGLSAWATRIDDAIAAGSTGTEIVMGLRWTLSMLLHEQLSSETRRVVADLVRYLDRTLR